MSRAIVDDGQLDNADRTINRCAMNQEEFDLKFAYSTPKENILQSRVKKALGRCYKPMTSPKDLARTLVGLIPIINWLPRYAFKDDLIFDIVGGLTVGIMHVPQGIAYASLAHVPAVVGLYVSFFPPIFYMLFGTSRHNSLGSFAVVSLMAAIVADREVANCNQAISESDDVTGQITTAQVTTTLAFTIGIVHLVMGLFRCQFIATYFSDQVVAGFATAASVHVFVAQLKDVLAISELPKRSGPGQLFLKTYDIVTNLHRANPFTIMISIVAIGFLLVGKQLVTPFVKRKLNTPIPIPFELILIIIATILSKLLNLEQTLHVKTVGDIPTGFPRPHLPVLWLIPNVLADAIGIAAVIYAVHISLAKMIAKKLNYSVDASQELYASGLTAILSSFFPVYPISSSLGRTLVSVAAGTRSQLSSIPSSCLLMAVILFLGKYLHQLPMCILSAIIIVALSSMLNKFADLKRLYPLSITDFSIWLVSFVSTVAIDVMQGLIISLLYAIFTTVFRTQWPHYHTLINLNSTSDYRDGARYHLGTNYPGIHIFRFDAPLLFTNVDRFKQAIYRTLDEWERSGPRMCNYLEPFRTPRHRFNEIVRIRLSTQAQIVEQIQSLHFVIDCSGITFVDYMGVNTLKEIFSEMHSRKVLVYFASAKAPVRELFESSGFYKYVPKENFYPSIHDAVTIALQRQHSSRSVEQGDVLAHDVIEEMVLTRPLY